MPPIARAFIFLAIGAGLQAIIGFAVFPALFGGTSTTTLVLGSILTIWAAAYGFITGLKGVYAIDRAWAPRSIALFVDDVTWSAINTITGHFFMIYCAVKGTFAAPDERSQKSGMIHFTGAALPGAGATTIGNVMGGTWMTHELIHAQQARLFGPFYWFTYLGTYVLNLIPSLIMWIAKGRKQGEEFQEVHWTAYGKVVMEDWAYHAAPGDTINLGQWFLWLLLALVNATGVVLILAAIGPLGFVAGLIGLAILLVYAIIRAFFPKAD